MRLTSPAFDDSQLLPARFARDHENLSPPLHVEDPPAGTRSFVLIVDDPDAPGGDFVHWLVFNIPGEVRDVAQGAAPAEATEGLNSWKELGWGGPQPPSGIHTYFFRLYALDTERLELPERSTQRDVLGAMDGHVLERAVLTGKYAA